jgi:SIR2-like protein
MGRLVPFVGAGMSMEKLVGWEGFVQNLEKKANVYSVGNDHPEIRAQRAAAKLRHSGNDAEFIDAVRESLKGEKYNDLGIPAQTAALARSFWPLTISTNYDDLLYGASIRASQGRLRPLVLGRSASDCKRIMSSLVSPFDREIIWHIQGFVGGLHPDCPAKTSGPDAPFSRLQQELVIGHSEYRKVTTTAVHFRRCFGEVFRTRSFLFVGTRLSEEYFWNLFGEVLELCGPSPVPHFALLRKDAKVDIRFLAEEMNITVLQYRDHARLPVILGRLHREIIASQGGLSRLTLNLASGASLEVTSEPQLPIPEAEFCGYAVALIVRAAEDGTVLVNSDQEKLRKKFAGQTFSEGVHVISPAKGLFAVRALTGDPHEKDSIGTAMKRLLDKIDRRCKVLHLYLPAEGGTVPPVYGFIEAVRAYGQWTARQRSRLRMVVYVGPQVMLNLTAHQIDLGELVTSRLIRFWTVVDESDLSSQDGIESVSEREPVRRALYMKPHTKLRKVLVEVLGDIDPTALHTWHVSLCPSPQHDLDEEPDRHAPGQKKSKCVTAWDLRNKTLCDVGIVFGSVLTLERATLTAPPELLRRAEGTWPGLRPGG